MTPGISTALWFVVIIAMIPAVLWLLKRTPMGGAGGQGLMRTVAVLPVGNHQRLLTVEVGTGDDRRWLVLGVTAQQISTLHTMAPQADLPASAGMPFNETPFGQLMARLTKQNKG
jgi:flagellar protein FliO/FliZ